MSSVGMIHLACYCGAELFCLGELPKDVTRGAIIAAIKDHMGPGDIGILTPTDDLHGACPYCGLIYELPDPQLVNRLPYIGQDRIRSSQPDAQQPLPAKSDGRADSNSLGRFVN